MDGESLQPTDWLCSKFQVICFLVGLRAFITALMRSKTIESEQFFNNNQAPETSNAPRSMRDDDTDGMP